MWRRRENENATAAKFLCFVSIEGGDVMGEWYREIGGADRKLSRGDMVGEMV